MVNIIRLVVELNDYHDNSRIFYKLDESVASSPSAQSFVVLIPNHITISEALAIIVKKHNEIYPERPPLSEQGIYLHHTGINTDIRDASIRLCDIFDEWGKGVWSPRVKIVCKPDAYKNNTASTTLSCPPQHSQNSVLSNVYDSTAVRSSQNYFTSPNSIAIQNRGSQTPNRTQDKKSPSDSSLSSSSSSKLVREIRKCLKKKISVRKGLHDKSKTDLVTRKTSADYSPRHSSSDYNEHAKKVPRHSHPQPPTKCIANQTETSPYLGSKRRRDETMLLQSYSDELRDQGANYQADTASKKLHLSDKKKQKNEGPQQRLNKANHDSVFSNVNETEKEEKSAPEKNLSATKRMDSSAESASELSAPPIAGKDQIPLEDSQSVISSQEDPLLTSSSVPQHREDKKPANPIRLHDLLNDHRTHIEHQFFDDNKMRKVTNQRLYPIVDVSTKYPIRKGDSGVADSRQPLGNEYINDAEKQSYVKNEDRSAKKYIENSSKKQKRQKDLAILLTTPISDPDPNCSSKKDKSEKKFDLQNPDSSASLSDSSSSEDNEEQIATFKKYTSGLHSNLTAHVQEKTGRKNYKGVFSSSDPPGPFKHLKKTKSIIDQTDQNIG